jgi:hypothetical protein
MRWKVQNLMLVVALACAVSAPVWAANPGDVIITEIMYYPNSAQASGCPLTEWIEIYNTTDGDIDLTGWYTADEDGRAGDFEPYVLPAHGIAVIIPRGNYDTGIITKDQFTAAWGTPASQLIQPTELNDMSGDRPENLPLGGIAGNGLDNTHASADADPSNDLVNTPFDPIMPCFYGQLLCDPALPDNEVLLLVDNTGQIIDEVNWDDEPGNGWPFEQWHGWSIMLDQNHLNAADNDVGTSWIEAVPGVQMARNNIVSWPFNKTDTGSPGFIAGVSPDTNTPPLVAPQTVLAARNYWVDITLSAADDGQPAPAAISFTVETLPANGTLTDVGNNHVIAANELPYKMPGQKNVLRYTNTGGACADTSFNYHADDNALNSASATVTLQVQCGDVIITEIMYHPNSSEGTPKVVEWIEVYNTTAAPIDVTSWYLADTAGRAGDWPATSIPAHGVAVIVPPGSVERSRVMDPTQFTTAWDGYTIPQIIQPTLVNDEGSPTVSPYQGNITKDGLGDGDDVRLVDATGKIQDRVVYKDGSPWVAHGGGGSIYLKTGNYNAGANDKPSAWWLSVDCAGGAYSCLSGGKFKVDSGSPGYLEGVTPKTGNVPPTAVTNRIGVLKDTPTLITLPGCDDGQPGGPMVFQITKVSAVTNGTLEDPTVPGVPITTVPYTLPGNKVLYKPNPGFTSAWNLAEYPNSLTVHEDSFSYNANDGVKASRADGTLSLPVQKGGIILTEIMSSPQNKARNDWQYYEVYNPTPNDLTLMAVTTRTKNQTHMLVNTVIPAGAIRVVTTGDNGSRTAALFLYEWYHLDPDSVIRVDATQWDKVGSTSDRLQLLDENYELMDEVYFGNGASAEWPMADGQASLYLKTGKFNAIDNDEGTNWALSVAGTDGAYATPYWNVPPTSDVGSPGLVPSCNVPAQDADGDGDVDLADFGIFQGCFNGPNRPWATVGESQKCACLDQDADRDVDLADFGTFQGCFNGPNRPPACD